MLNIYEELFLVNTRNIDGTLEFELSREIKKLIDEFLDEKYNTSLIKCGSFYDEKFSRVIVNDVKFYFDEILGGTGNGVREKEFIRYLKSKEV